MQTTHEVSSGNVFADLGLPNSEQELVKAKLTVQIYQILKDRGLTQTEAAQLLGTTQAQVSTLMRCRPVSVSVGKLMEFLTILGRDVEVTVKPAGRQGAGHRRTEAGLMMVNRAATTGGGAGVRSGADASGGGVVRPAAVLR
jgi:predicted XRE-type DNA-binding protein